MAEQVQDEVQGGVKSGGRRLGPLVVALVVVGVGCAAAYLAVSLSGGRRAQYVDEGQRRTYESAWLDIPVLEIKDIPLSVPLAGGAQRKQLTVGVVVRFAPPEGENADLGRAQKEIARRLGSLRSEFRHIVIEEMNSKDYASLSTAEQQNLLLQTFRQRFTNKLKECDLYRHVRIYDVMWADFFWN